MRAAHGKDSLSASYGIEVLNFQELIKKENPHLDWALLLLQRLLHFHPATVNITAFQVYSVWRNRVESLYWENMAAKDIPEPER